MIRKTVYFWEEKPGVQSSIRLQMFFTLLFAFWMTYLDVTGKGTVSETILFMLYVSAFTPKLISKVGELKGFIKKDEK